MMEVSKMEPVLLAVVSRRFETIAKEMVYTLWRTARSSVLASGRDFSCGITDGKARSVSISEGIPVQAASAYLVPKAILELFGDDLHPGDCILNNCGYFGNSHHADYTIVAPVFYKDELLFFTLSRGHMADCGCYLPTTYLPHGKDIYMEGPHFPCVRVQRDYKDIEDVLRIPKINLRVPEQWYGDYLGMVGAVRIGERRLVELCDKYGVETIKLFMDEWLEYGKRRMIEEIRKLPKGTKEGETRHDPIPEVAPDGIPIKVKISVDPDEGYITVDLMDNIDNVPGGYNLTEATAYAAAYSGIWNCLDPTIPHNHGSQSRVKILLRDGCVVGRPKFPAGTSIATTNVWDRLVTLVQVVASRFNPERGLAEGCYTMPAGDSVIHGIDWRRNNSPYMDQLTVGSMGGPGVRGHDGWVEYISPCVAGGFIIGGIEILEYKHPIIWEKWELKTDSGGAGQWDGAPSVESHMRPRHDAGTWAYFNDGILNPPKGIEGGQAGAKAEVWKYRLDDPEERIELPTISVEEIKPGEVIASLSCGGGGYGDPLDRAPDLIRHKAREGYISVEKARQVYGVVLDTRPEKYKVDYEATNKLREELRKQRQNVLKG